MVQLVIRPNKPIMFAVIHLPKKVEKAIDRFREAIKGRKVLYVELPPSKVNQVLREGKYHPKYGSYERLVLEASKAGLRVVPLDVEEALEERKKTIERMEKLGEKKGYHDIFTEFMLREKKCGLEN